MLHDDSDSNSGSDSNSSSDDIAEDNEFVKCAEMEGAYKGTKSPFGLPHTVQEQKLKMAHEIAKNSFIPSLTISVGCHARTLHGQMGVVTKLSAHKALGRRTATMRVNGIEQKFKYRDLYGIHGRNAMVKHKKTGQWMKVAESDELLVLQPIHVASKEQNAAAASTEKDKATASTEKDKASASPETDNALASKEKNAAEASKEKNAEEASKQKNAAASKKTSNVTATAPPPEGHSLLPRQVVARPARLLEIFLDHHLAHLPDITDLTKDHPSIQPGLLQHWLNKELCKGQRERRRPHNDMPGLCGQMYLQALDFAIANNKWAVRFKDADGKWIDMTDDFIVTVWVAYINRMVRTCLSHRHVCLSIDFSYV